MARPPRDGEGPGGRGSRQRPWRHPHGIPRDKVGTPPDGQGDQAEPMPATPRFRPQHFPTWLPDLEYYFPPAASGWSGWRGSTWRAKRERTATRPARSRPRYIKWGENVEGLRRARQVVEPPDVRAGGADSGLVVAGRKNSIAGLAPRTLPRPPSRRRGAARGKTEITAFTGIEAPRLASSSRCAQHASRARSLVLAGWRPSGAPRWLGDAAQPGHRTGRPRPSPPRPANATFIALDPRVYTNKCQSAACLAGPLFGGDASAVRGAGRGDKRREGEATRGVS